MLILNWFSEDDTALMQKIKLWSISENSQYDTDGLSVFIISSSGIATQAQKETS